MNRTKIKSTKPVKPMIYAYTTPEIKRHDGWTKIGYTEQDVKTRIEQQTHTADVEYRIEWTGTAIFEDGSYERFNDKDFHAYLRKSGVEQEKGKNNEWFHITGNDSRIKFYDFKANHGFLKSTAVVIPYILREEQEKAVVQTLEYQQNHESGEFLWNAKPRFGKTLSVYDFCKRSGAEKILIVTNRPAIANSWFSDYAQFLGAESGYSFVSEVDALKGRAGVFSRMDYLTAKLNGKATEKSIEFVSLQDLKGSLYFGGQFDKLREVKDIQWDILVIDEAHEGVDTYKTDIAFEQIKCKFTLHLSGTPFKALANQKFSSDAIFNWTYADEQKAKQNWDNSAEVENPYENLPQLNLFTYQMSEIVREQLSKGMELDGETVEYAFDLNEFFKVENNKFVYDSAVNKFLNALTTQKKFPFSTDDLRAELKHTFWLLNRVESARLLAKKLEAHPVFGDYKIILAAGDGKLDDADENKKSYDKVVEAIQNFDKTITLSVGQLTTGITIPEWTAVLMLSNVKSPSLYMQAAFRAQNPCLFQTGAGFERKKNAYVFDFDPARTLTIFEEFANDLSSNTSSGRGTVEDRQENIRQLLNFFPVIGEDAEGELIELNAEQVLTIPRKIRSQEVVKRGFMSDFLFQSVSHIFSAPQEVVEIIDKFTAVQEPKNKLNLTPERTEALSLDENGEVSIPEEYVVGRAKEIFGEKIYGDVPAITESIETAAEQPEKAKSVKKMIQSIQEQAESIIEEVKNNYGDTMTRQDEKNITAKLKAEAESITTKTVGKYAIEKAVIELEKQEALNSRSETGRTVEEINQEYEQKQEEAAVSFRTSFNEAIGEFLEESKKDTILTVETNQKEREKKTVESDIRDHLRGFSRTIPSFLMAYGDDTVTLATFDKIIPDEVFQEVTSITLEQFRFLRDGGTYLDSETGKEKEFQGGLFDPVVFDDSVKEFLNLRKKLANYFDESSTEDIFDYIPPQKTNQIFTPKEIVRKMVDMLERENPGCFDDPDKTFIDLYMKSGLYITEIVKRLYQSDGLKKQFPDENERLKHIFEKQVYGLAPTEIIYRIAINYILGFTEDAQKIQHNFNKKDALPYTKNGTLNELLDELYIDNRK